MYSRFALIPTAVIILASCGGEAEKTMDAMQNMQSIAESADDAAKSVEQMEDLRKERIKRGDTLAMPYADLQKYLPQAISGYTMEEPEGESVEVPGMSHSRASANYVRSDGARITVNIYDYNNGSMGYAAATTMFALKMKIDNDNERAATFQTDNSRINGYERVGKKDGQTQILYGVAGRFLIEVEGADKASFEDVKATANRIGMDDLATK